MRDSARSARLVGIQAVILAALCGCAALSELPVSDDIDSDGTGSESGFSYTRVMELLHDGEADRAETILRSRLDAVPGDSRARDLLRQIEAPPAEYLGEADFEYEVQPGESLSVLAQRFLGNHRLFFVLARYNDIDKPSLVQSGRMVRIPSDYWDGPGPSREPLDREIRAREYLAEARLQDALQLYEDVKPDALGRDELALLGTVHRRWIERALDNGELDSTRERLDAAHRRAPDNDGWEDWLGELERRTIAETAYREGLALQESDPVAAARALNRALKTNPRHSRARDALSALRGEAVPELHREAVLLYRNQKLDEAIRLWEQVLSIDPDFRPARGYRTRAEELRRRLEALD